MPESTSIKPVEEHYVARLASYNDIPAILDLEQRYIPADIAYDEATIRKWFDCNPEMFWVQETDSVITAFSIITPIDDVCVEMLNKNIWCDMDEFPTEHVLSSQTVFDILASGGRVHYYWSDIVSETGSSITDIMYKCMLLIFTTGKLVFGTPATTEGQRLLIKRGFDPVDASNAGIHCNYSTDVTSEKIVNKYNKLFPLLLRRITSNGEKE